MRYVAYRRPRAYWDDDVAHAPNLTVFEKDDSPQETGLLDASGTPLYRVPEARVMGFDPRRWAKD